MHYRLFNLLFQLPIILLALCSRHTDHSLVKMCQFPSLLKPFPKATPCFLSRKYYCLISLTGLNLSPSSWLILEDIILQHHLPHFPFCKKFLTSHLYLLFTLSYPNYMPFLKRCCSRNNPTILFPHAFVVILTRYSVSWVIS